MRKAILAILVAAVAVPLGFSATDAAGIPGDHSPSGHGATEVAKGRLLTRWAKSVSPDTVHREYPRPQMVRPEWLSLNGLWDCAITGKDDAQPREFDREILVPFPVESALSGVMQRAGREKQLWYRRTFEVPRKWSGQRLLLHFGAVDWETHVWVNGKQVGIHRGGYDPFTFDVTDALDESERQEIVVAVWDPTDEGTQPRGKQRNEPRGIWYTPATGIWQTVWLEPVPQRWIDRLVLTPDVDRSVLKVRVELGGREADEQPSTVTVKACVGDRLVAEATSRTESEIELPIRDAKLWSPDHPFLYQLKVKLNGENSDSVSSYFGMRKISLGNDQNGITRMFLNDEPLFQFGPLDQGFWPDGLYTAPSDEALRYDLEVTKKLGFNTIRKHVKVEPARWYYWCDKLGLLVWQDMPNGDKHAPWPHDGAEIQRKPESAAQFERELKSLVDSHHNHPSIVVWVPFNEAWGQYDTMRITRWLKQHDPTRLVIGASGGNDFPVGDIKDDHFYPGPGAPPALTDRAAVLGEFGGLGLPLEGHTWQDEKNWGYRSFRNREDLTAVYLDLMKKLRPLIESRLSAAVYTQTTDVEVEVNGLMTYDREVLKLDIERVTAAHRKLYEPLPKLDPAELSEARTLAYWRFEDGEPGRPVPNIKDQPKSIAVRDVSGHNNHLYAFGRPQSPAYSSSVSRASLSHGRANRGSLDDTAAPDGSPTRDLFTNPGWSRTHMDIVNTFPLKQWTVEASFQLAELRRTHGVVGKDGKPTDSPHAPLQLRVRGDDNTIEIQAIDSRGTLRQIRSESAAKSGQWYHAAAVSDGTKLQLFLQSDGSDEYQLQGQTDFAGPLILSNGTWTVGRGFHDGRIGDDARALIDEVRISATARTTDQFLFAAQVDQCPTAE